MRDAEAITLGRNARMAKSSTRRRVGIVDSSYEQHGTSAVEGECGTERGRGQPIPDVNGKTFAAGRRPTAPVHDWPR